MGERAAEGPATGGWAAAGRESDGTMQAVWIREFGDPDGLELREVDRPRPGRGEIRVRVAASGVNRADLVQRRGHYPPPPGWPERIPGLEFAGRVEAVGAGVRSWREADPVMGLVGGGGCGEYVVVPEREAIRVPEGMSVEEAGAVPEVFVTAWDALDRQMDLRSGETVLIHAVGSGVGTAALQLARVAGARTLGTSRTPEKVERAERLGLHHGIVADGDWAGRVLELTGERGVEGVLDLVGGAYLEGNLRVLAIGGRQVVVGVPGGTRAEVDLRRLMVRRATIRGTVLRARPGEEKAALARAFDRRVVPLLADGRLRPVVDRILPAAEAEAAHRLLEENRAFGKILLRWG